MSNNLLTKHFKSEKKRISLFQSEKKLDIQEIKPPVVKPPSNPDTEDTSKSNNKTRRSRLNKKEIDSEYEMFMKTNTKRAKVNNIVEELKLPKTKVQTKKKVDLTDKEKELNLTFGEGMMNKKKENETNINISEINDSEMKDNQDEITTKTDSKSKDERIEQSERISDKTRQTIEKALNKIKKPADENKNTNNIGSTNVLENILRNQQPLIVTPEKKKELTGKTLEILNRLRSERKNKFERSSVREREQSDSIYSMRFRFEELVEEKRKLPLPPKYKNLINVMSDLDGIINMCKIMKKVPRFDNIKRDMEMTLHKKITFDQFEQILYIAPYFYIYKWEKMDNCNENHLIIDFPYDFKERIKNKYDDKTVWKPLQTNVEPIKEILTQNELEERKKIFYNHVIYYINEIHIKFLKENHLTEFNAIELQTWHSSFDLRNIKDIPQFQIDIPKENTQSINDILKESDLKSRLVREALDNLTKNEITPRKDDTNSNTVDSLSTPKLKQALNNISVFDKIRAKQEAIKQSKEILEYSLFESSKKISPLNYKEFLFKIRDIFISKQTTALKKLDFYNILLESYPMSRIEEGLNFFTKFFPNYISFVDTMNSGKMVKIDKSTNVKEILDKIDSMKM